MNHPHESDYVLTPRNSSASTPGALLPFDANNTVSLHWFNKDIQESGVTGAALLRRKAGSAFIHV